MALPVLPSTYFASNVRKPVFGQNSPNPPENPLPPLAQPYREHLEKMAETKTASYRKRFQQVLDDAKAHLMPYITGGQAARSAVVLDLDETLLDNSVLEFERLLKGALERGQKFFRLKINWVERAEAPAIPETLAFVNWLRENRFPIFFVSARKKRHEAATIRNLEAIGLPPGSYGLYLKDNKDFGSATPFKVNAQHDIEKQGFKVVAVIGDQDSDIAGALGRGFKLPNPLYEVG